MQKILLLLLCLPILSFATYSVNNETAGSSVQNVTVYRNGAELVHTATANLKQGTNELVIEGISSSIDMNSVQINYPATITILGMEFNNNFLGEENMSPVAKKLKDSIEKLSADMKHIDVLVATYTDLLDVLHNNKEVKGQQTGLNVAELTKLMSYYETKSVEVNNKLMAATDKKNKLQLLSLKLNNQLAEEQKKNTIQAGRLILQLSVAIQGNHSFTIAYFTPNAYWIPYYDIRSESIKSPLKFIYKAKIAQTTGIDLKKVKLTLSTSTPAQFGNAPILKTWFLSYINPYNVFTNDLSKSNSIQFLQGKVAGLSLNEEVVTTASGTQDIRIRGSNSFTNGNGPVYVVNGNIMEASEFSKIRPDAIKKMQVLKDNAATSLYGSRAANGAIIITLKDGLDDYVTVSSSELDISYDIDIPYDVPTTGKQQIATLKQTEVPARYKYYSVPKLDKEAFLLAEIPHWQILNLIPGEANVIFEGTYIGKTFIDPANTNDTLNVTLGTDKRLVLKREKVIDYNSAKLIGSNKIQTINYEITVKNNKKEAVDLLLKDQFPVSTNNEIEVKLLESSNGAVSDEIGVVTWAINIEPGENKKFRISYTVKYPKGKTVNIN